MHYLFSISGGVQSWAAARLTIDETAGPDDKLTALFADTLVEEEDVYRFLEKSTENLGVPLVRLCDGRKPWELFLQEGFIGNARSDICSRVLKREKLDKWRETHCNLEDTVSIIGISWEEVHRLEGHRAALAPWRVEAPLIERGWSKKECVALARKHGMPLPKAYSEGFAHANCSGMCVKGGHGHWSRLYRLHPERFHKAMRDEETLRTQTGKDVSVLRDRRGGKTRSYTLRELKNDLDAQPELFPPDDGGGCGCALHEPKDLSWPNTTHYVTP